MSSEFEGNDTYALTLRLLNNKGIFDKNAMQEGYRNNDWLRARLTFADVFDVATRIELITNKFLQARICMWLFYILGGASCFCVGFGIKALIDYLNRKSSDDRKSEEGWLYSIPFLVAVVVVPLLCVAVYFLRRCVYERYQARISQYFAQINEELYKRRNLYWRVGPRCSFIQLSIIMLRLDSCLSIEGSGGIEKAYLRIIPRQTDAQQRQYQQTSSVYNSRTPLEGVVVPVHYAEGEEPLIQSNASSN